MAFNGTKISDVIVPEIFAPYMIERTTEKSALLSSGIATPDNARIAAMLGEGGKSINLPFWDGDINGDDDVLVDGEAMSVTKIKAGNDIAAVHVRGKAFAATDLSKFFSGDDPMGAIADVCADWWSIKMQKTLLASLKGIFATTAVGSEAVLSDTNVLDNSTAVISYDVLVQAMYLLGDNFNNITAIAMHSAVMSKLAQLRLLDTYPNAKDREPYYTTLLGKRIIVDDALAPTSNVYPVYFFGEGAIAFNEATGLVNVETDRDKLVGADYLITRRAFTMHPRGVKWIGTPAGETPSNTELETGSNWALVAKPKHVRIALLKTKIA